MRNLNHMDKSRIPYRGSMGDSGNGAFELKVRGEKYIVVASNGGGWDHVSVSHKHKIPSWRTMCEIKGLFFEDSEPVMQLHPAQENHINICHTCLHLWRPQRQEIPLPNKLLV